MVCYKCIYCQQTFIYKGNYVSHNKNIQKCKNKFEEQIIRYKKYTNEKLLYDYNNLIINESNYKCKFCYKNYNSYNGLKRHLLECCSTKQNTSCITNTNNTINNTTNNITNNVTNNTNNGIINNGTINITNINLTPYDKIKYDEIELDLLKELFEIPGMALAKLTHCIFFDPENKENHVIFCPNLKDNQILVYTKNELSPDGWEFIDKKEFFEGMIRSQLFILGNLRDYNIKEENPLEIKSFDNFNNMLKKMDLDEKKKEYIKKLNNICYQNNSIVQKTRQ
jgi:hypothetical protein